MKNHLKLGIAVIALAGIAYFLIVTHPEDRSTTSMETHEHEGEEAGHEEGEGATHEGHGTEQAQQEGASVTNFVPQLPPAKGKRTRVRLETGMGPIEIILYDDLAPRTVKNFLDLTAKGYYKNMIFHRVAKGFVIQTGDPTGIGSGGPGYKIPDEIVPELNHNQPGVVAMASAGPDTAGSQFYITMNAAPHLDSGQYGRYSVFGQVVKGMEVAAAINGVVVDQRGRPISPVAFRGVEVLGQE